MKPTDSIDAPVVRLFPAYDQSRQQIDDPNYILKLKILGEPGVGKRCLLVRFTDGTYTDSYTSTLGVAFKVRDLSLPSGETAKVQVWTPEKIYEKSNGAASANGYIVAVDVTDTESLSEAKKLLQTLREGIPFIIVGTKCDQKTLRVVESKELTDLGSKTKAAGIFETSAETGANVDAAFQTLVAACIEKIKKDEKARRSIFLSSSTTKSSVTMTGAAPDPVPKSRCVVM